MEELITSLNETLDIEKFNYKTFSQLPIFMLAGLKYIHNRYNTNVLFIYSYIQYNFYQKFNNNLETYLDMFSMVGKKYMVIPFSITKDRTGHSNLLFFYKKKGMVYCERYDPEYSCCIMEDYHDHVDMILYKEFTKFNVTYISPKNMSVVVCPQAYIKDNFGYCQTYTLIYLDNLLKNTGKNRLKVMSEFPTENDLNEFIKNVVKMILKLPNLTKYDKDAILNYDTISKNTRNYISSLLFLIIS